MRRNSRLGALLSSTIPAGEALQMRLRALQSALDRELARLTRNIGPEGVHRTRIAARRQRVLLRAFRKSLDSGAAKEYRRALRALGRELDRLRDADVALRGFDALALEERPALTAARARLVAERTLALNALRTSVRSVRWRLRAIAMRRAVEDAALVAALPGPLSGLVEQVLARERRRTRRALRGARRGARALHRLRLATKRMRYLAEECIAARRGAAREEIEALHGLQDCLGELHDGWLLRKRLRVLVPQRRTGRLLRERLDRRERKLLQGFRRRRRRLLRLWRGLDRE